MNDTLRGHDEVPPTLPSSQVTYALKVLASERRPSGVEVRTVLFQRTSPSESIEISAETDAPNLLAKLPELLDAALELQRALWPSPRLSTSLLPLLTEESRLVRWLSEGGETAAERRVTEKGGVLRLLGMAYRALRPEALFIPTDACAPTVSCGRD